MKKLPILLSALLLLLILPAVWLNARQGVAAGEHFLFREDAQHYRADDRNEIVGTVSENGARFDILLDGQTSSALLVWDGDRARVEFDDGAVVEGDWNGATLVNLSGAPADLLTNPSATASVSADVVRTSLLAVALCRIDLGLVSPSGSLWLVILGAIVYVFGILNLFWPRGMHLLRSRLHYNYQELSDESGRRAQIFSGVIAILSGLLCMYFSPLFQGLCP